VAIMADGSLLVSDDQNGVIYRISYQEPGADSTSENTLESSTP